jgi:hypothetical protein
MSRINPYLWDIIFDMQPINRGISTVKTMKLSDLPEKDRKRIERYNIKPYKKPCVIPILIRHEGGHNE